MNILAVLALLCHRLWLWSVTEAEYAFSLKKTIIPLKLEAGYSPDGWLGLLIRSKLYYDFSAPEKFNSQWRKLNAKLKDLKHSGFEYYNRLLYLGWRRSTVVERWSLTGELSLSCA